MDKRREQLISFGGVVALALALPIFLRGVNYVQRALVGAEGRLAAIAVETDHPLGPLPQPWRALAQGGEAESTFLDTDSDKIKALGPKYIRIDHMYDGFNVIGQNLELNWTELDKLVDKITATGALPFFSLGYMPATIASGDLVSEPKNWSDWQTVVQKTVEHYSGEKGLDNVYYEVWNEPDLFGKWTMGGKKDYKQLYLYSARGASNARGVKPFKLGGPATTGLYKNWLDNFLPYVLENNLRLDFISWHRYDLDIEKYTEDVASVDTWLDKHPYYANVEKIVSEMGPASDKENVNNSMMGAAHLIASAREFLFKIKYGFNFSVKDGPGNDNGWGIISSTGQTKPRYQALQMLSRLGDSRLAVTGEGSWVRAIAAQSNDSYQVVVVNYDPKNSHSEAVPVSFINLTPGKFILQQTRLGGTTSKTEVATTEAILQQQIPLTPNSAVFLELTPVNPPSE